MVSFVPLSMALVVGLIIAIIGFFIYLRLEYRNQSLRFETMISFQNLKFWLTIIVIAIVSIIINIALSSVLDGIKPSNASQSLQIISWLSLRAAVDVGIKLVLMAIIVSTTSLVTDRFSLFKNAFIIGLGSGLGMMLSQAIQTSLNAVTDPSGLEMASSSLDGSMLIFIHAVVAVMMVYGVRISSERDIGSFLSITFVISLLLAFLMHITIYIGSLFIELNIISVVVGTLWLLVGWWILFGFIFLVMRFVFDKFFHLAPE